MISTLLPEGRTGSWLFSIFTIVRGISVPGLSLLPVHRRRGWKIKLADLRSRLHSGVVFQLHELSDSEKPQLLRRRAEALGIRLPDAVVNYVLGRHDRNPAALMNLLQNLDRQSLERKRRITIPLIKEIMDW